MRQTGDDRHAAGAMTRRGESASAPGGLTARAAWRGAGASLLLHLLVGAAVIVALSGPPKAPPRVIDLTLLPPAEIGRRPDPSAIVVPTEPAGTPRTAVLPGPSPVPGPPTPPALPIVPMAPAAPSPPAANPPDGTARANPPTPAAMMNPSAPGSSHGPAATAASTGRIPVHSAAGDPSATAGVGTAGAGTAVGSYAWIRDAIQHAITYPPTARRMGWEGKVVVAFRLLSDGSVRDVRIVRGSGHAALDRGAIDAVRNASPFPRSPGEAEIITPVHFHLLPTP